LPRPANITRTRPLQRGQTIQTRHPPTCGGGREANWSEAWQAAQGTFGLPRVTFHALRHTHASALIAAGLDVVKISRRLGHADPTLTLRSYAHLFDKVDTAAASAIEAALRTRSER